MNQNNSGLARPGVLGLAIGGVALIAAGALGMFLYLRAPRTPVTGISPPSAAAAPGPSASSKEAVLTLAPEALSRAGIQSSVVRSGTSTRGIAVPGVVEPNAYRQTIVAAAAAGHVRSVSAELGAHVRQGQALATIQSPALAEAAQVYVSMQAELLAAHHRLVRLEGLVKIGAASREELEAAQSEHAKHATDVEGARARLLFLGVSADRVSALVDATRIDPMMTVTAPSGGVVTRRSINPGQYIESSAELFTIADQSMVWIVGDLYERDLGRVRVGSRATMTSAAFPGQAWHGIVTYIDPQVAPDTRTARFRVETSNPDERLRLGMYLEMAVSDAAPVRVLLLPRSAVQMIGSQSVVYVADEKKSGQFVERAVRLGATTGDDVEVTSGLTEGERVVTSGSFFLRAERDRLGLPPPVAAVPPAPDQTTAPVARLQIAVTKNAFVPASVTMPVGKPIDIVFTRQTDDTCATEVVIPSLNVRKALPLKKPVVVRIPARAAGEITFACGMNMLRGTVVVR